MPNLSPLRPGDGTYLKDDFCGNAQVADHLVGELLWEITGIGNGSTVTLPTAEPNGVVRDTTAVTADGDGNCLHGLPDQIVLNGLNGFFTARVRYPAISGNVIADNNFRIGLDDSVTASSPAVGIWVDSDAGVLSLQVDSANGDYSDTVTNVSTLTSGTTMVLGTWHDFHVKWSEENANGGPKIINLYVDGELGATVSTGVSGSDEEVELKIAHWQDSGSGDTLDLDVDWFELFLPRA
jgi:hypothetical protein